MNRRSFLARSAAAAALLPAMIRPASAAALGDDLKILREALKLHPGLYRYATPQAVEARLAALAPQFLDATDAGERMLVLQRFLAAIRCGHTHCNPFNQSRTMATTLYDRPTRLPFAFTWIGGQMVVTDPPPQAPAMVRGSVVTDINGVAPATMLRALLPFARADGGNDAKRVSLLAMRNTERFEEFDIYQGIAFPPPATGHVVRYRPPGGSEVRIALPALTLAERRARLPDTSAAEREARPLWDWRMAGDVAVLTMPTWVTYRSRWDWQAWLDARLDSLSGARGLVIDLRDNEGGTDCGAAILARLTPRDLTLPGYEMRVRYRRTPAALDPYLDTWDASFRTAGEGAVPVGDGFYRRADSEPIDRIARRGRPVTVPVAALVGPVCSSATYIFARRARASGLVRLFGETTGGNLRGINGGAYFFVRLPASGLAFDLPIYGYFPATPQPESGVRPNVRIARSIADIAQGRDPAMAAATAWLRRG